MGRPYNELIRAVELMLDLRVLEERRLIRDEVLKARNVKHISACMRKFPRWFDKTRARDEEYELELREMINDHPNVKRDLEFRYPVKSKGP